MSKSVKKQPVECCTNPVVKLFTGKLSIQSTGDTGVNSSSRFLRITHYPQKLLIDFLVTIAVCGYITVPRITSPYAF